ncbi:MULTISPECIES: TDP-N-acetylfucosamine:lipid II N-acetylfucosaminyltransferase [unclassified Pseudoalteromonas]|uniref:TDP-N-acetylfucosamine:lipid II N-acetylfucosaminyltransferase n=1 Tax=unclassified Pseudoalteromonas TaxID=194690 RepID=UPI0030151EA7
MKKILHVCSDEKFIDSAIANFNAISHVKSDFLVISKESSLEYIKNKNVTIKSKSAFLLQILIGRLKEYDAVVFHSLNGVFKFFIKLIPKRLNICWVGFGFDYYDYNKILPGRKEEKKGLRYFIKYSIFNLDASYQKINYFCPVLESEFEEVSKRLRLNAQYVDWNYGSSDKVVKKLKHDYIDGDSILLGNSATETNNHLEIIDDLVKLNEKREIIVPLSYGDSEYAEKIIAKLKSTSLNYTILRDFLTQEEYFSTLKRCAFVIMNHKRQEAAGNVLIMLSLGAKVFLDKDNPLYDYFKCMGFRLFNKENLNFDCISMDDMGINKSLSLKFFNSEVTIKKTKSLVDKLV